MSVEVLEPTKLRASSVYHRLASFTATTINAANNASSSNSSVNSNCSGYSSGSSNNNNLITNMSGSSISNNNNNNNNNLSACASKFIDIKKFVTNFFNKSVILDCRVLKEYENKHIQSSVHINCRDKITKKRLSTKKLSVKDIISCEETKTKIENYCGLCPLENNKNNDNLIVIYDDSTNDDNDLYLDQNPLQIVLENIKHTFKNNNCKILKGGFKEFAKEFPEYCTQKEKPVISQPINDAYYANCEESFKYAIDNAKITKILDHLYLGNECDAKNKDTLLNEGIKYVINVTRNIPNYHEDSGIIQYKRISVNDACNQNLRQFFEETNKFIDEAKEKNAKVLVHCQAGISRSPTIVIAYLMNKFNISMNTAYNQVKDKRQIIGPNIMFLSQLHEYEKSLNIVENENNTTTTITNKNNENEDVCMTASIKPQNLNKTAFTFTCNSNNNNNTNDINTTKKVNNNIINNNNNCINAAAAIGKPLGFLTHMPMV